MTANETWVREWQTGDDLAVEEKRARNTSSASENKIHEDTVAKQYGFRGGLVPGATTYAYLASYLTRTLGPDWAAGGSSTVALVRPVYDGDIVRIGGTVVESTMSDGRGSVSIECWVDGPDGTRCAPASAALSLPVGRIEEDRPLFARTDQQPRRPEERGPISIATAPTGVPLPPVQISAEPDAVGRYLDDMDEHDPLFRHGSPFGPPLIHPGWWPSIANRVLSANFLLGPWIHTRSEIQHLGPALPGGTYRAYGQIEDAFEKRGHEYVSVDVVIADGNDSPVVRMRHTAIVVVAPRGA
jgi:acyl dehydratase